MRTNVIAFSMASEQRIKVIRVLFEYPKRQWSCSDLEEVAKMSHGTVFRTLQGLKEFGIVRSLRINKKDILYEIAHSPLAKELLRIVDIERITAKQIASGFIKKIRGKDIDAILLYGSTVRGEIRPESDIDILVIVKKENKEKEKKIYDQAAAISVETNKTISVLIMSKKEIGKEKNSQFIKSVEEKSEVLYGKKPF